MRAVVISANGKHFTSGLDLMDSGKKLLQIIKDPSRDTARRAMKLEKVIIDYQDCFTAIEDCSVPVIAAIQVSFSCILSCFCLLKLRPLTALMFSSSTLHPNGIVTCDAGCVHWCWNRYDISL